MGGDQQEDYGYGSDFQYDKQSDGHIFFTPELVVIKEIAYIADFLKHIAKKEDRKGILLVQMVEIPIGMLEI